MGWTIDGYKNEKEGVTRWGMLFFILILQVVITLISFEKELRCQSWAKLKFRLEIKICLQISRPLCFFVDWKFSSERKKIVGDSGQNQPGNSLGVKNVP